MTDSTRDEARDENAQPETFYMYRVFDGEGRMKHSSIYYGAPAAGVQPTPQELREAILVAAVYAGGDFEFPGHDEDVVDLRIELLGPYVIGAPLLSMTHAEYAAIPEEQLP